MPFPLDRRYTLEEYFSVEESSAVRHEFYQGQILAMPGASLRHHRITGNVFSLLRAAASGMGCEVFASDLRVRTPGGLYTYPDVMVVCGGVELSRHDRLDTVINPTAIIEVLSSSTASSACIRSFQPSLSTSSSTSPLRWSNTIGASDPRCPRYGPSRRTLEQAPTSLCER
jgi:Uma2 family endonuclease